VYSHKILASTITIISTTIIITSTTIITTLPPSSSVDLTLLPLNSISFQLENQSTLMQSQTQVLKK
jgi:hypothetical protein